MYSSVCLLLSKGNQYFSFHSKCFWDDDGSQSCFMLLCSLKSSVVQKFREVESLAVNSEMFSLRRTYFKEGFFIAFVNMHLFRAGFLLQLHFISLYKDIKELQQSLTHRCSSHFWLQALSSELRFSPELRGQSSPSLLCQMMNSKELTNIFYVSPTTANRWVNVWVASEMGWRNLQ